MDGLPREHISMAKHLKDLIKSHLEFGFGPNDRFVKDGTSHQVIKFDIVCLKIGTDYVAQAIVYVHAGGPEDDHDKCYLKVTDEHSGEGFVHALELLWDKLQDVYEYLENASDS